MKRFVSLLSMLVSSCHYQGLNLTLNCDDFFGSKTVMICTNITIKMYILRKIKYSNLLDDDKCSYNGTRYLKEFLHLKCFEQIDNDFWGYKN